MLLLVVYSVHGVSNMYSALRARICRLVWCPGACMVMLFPVYGYVMLAKSFLQQVRYHTYACFCRLVDTDGLIIHFFYIAFNKFPSVLTFP